MKRLCCFVFCVFFWVAIALFGCSDDSSSPTSADPKPTIYAIPATVDTSITLSFKANQQIQIVTTDSVNTNPDGPVVDCDLWTDADGIATCSYVIDEQACRGLPFMALIGKSGGAYFLVGTDFDTSFASDGQIELMINDWVFGDNAGQFLVRVWIK